MSSHLSFFSIFFVCALDALGFFGGPILAVQNSSFGSRQVSQLLDDRPEMTGVFVEGSPVWAWVIDRFNRGDNGHRCYWDNSEPNSNTTAEHQPRVTSRSVVVRVSSRTSISPLDKWVCLLYEFRSVEHFRTLSEDIRALKAGSLDAKSFAQKRVRHEFTALRETQAFVEAELHPVKDAKNSMTTALLAVPDSYEEFLDKFATNPLTGHTLISRYEEQAQLLLSEASRTSNAQAKDE